MKMAVVPNQYMKGDFLKTKNFILRHTGPGVVSMCNMGPDTNGSLFQVTFTQNPDMDERYVVFGCLCADESFDVLRQINSYGSEWGEPLEEVLISDCGVAYPDPTFLSATKQNYIAYIANSTYSNWIYEFGNT